MGRKWDPAVSRVGIGRTAALWGTGGLKAGAQRGVLEPLLYHPGRLLYLCRSDCACTSGGLTAGAGEIGDPWMGRELGSLATASVHRTAPEGQVGHRGQDPASERAA